MNKSCKKKSIEIAKLKKIKNRSKLKNQGLITSILKLESSNSEHNYMKHFNINTNVDNNNNTSVDDTNDDNK